MATISTIQKESTWGAEATKINQNFTNVSLELTKLGMQAKASFGPYKSSSNLPSGASENATAWVSATLTPPFQVWQVQSGKWVNTGFTYTQDIGTGDLATKEELAEQDAKLAELSSAKINIIRDNELDTLITPGIYQRYITEDGYYKAIYFVSKDGAGKFFQLKILITTTGSVDISSRSTENNGTSWSDWVDYQTDVNDSITSLRSNIESLQSLKLNGISDKELNSLITPGIYQRKPFGDYNVLYFVSHKYRTSLPYKISQMKLFVSNDGEITISSRSSEDGGGNWTDWSENIFYEMYTRIEKLENNTLNKENIFTYQNLYDELSSTKGKYLSQDGSEAENELYAISDFIPFTKGMGYLSSWVNGSANDNGSAYVILYDEDKLKVNSYDLNTCKGIATWEEGVSFAKFSIRNYQDGNVQIVIGKSKQSYRSYNKTFKTSLLGLEKSSTIEGTLTSQQTLSLPLSYIRKNNSISAEIEGNGITNFKIGYGLSGKYQGFWAEVTSTNVNICQFVSSETLKNTYQHNLTISDKVFVSIVSNYTTAKLVLVSNGKSFVQEIAEWYGGGEPAIYNGGNSSITVKLSNYPRDCKKDIWLYGDSYFSYWQTERWPHYLLEWGFNNFQLSHLPGINSQDMFNVLLTELLFGNPKYIVWCLGMNDNADANSTTPDSKWLEIINRLSDICSYRGIELILATIPSIPNKSHEGKNKWVRESGYRYIDFAKAVGATSDGTWDNDYLSSDEIHPSASGAKVLASKAIIDFPELCA